MNKTAKKTLIIIGIVLASIIGLFLLLYFILFLIGVCSYGEARDERKYVCAIPEINSGWAPQGITYTGEDYILTGYDSDDSTVMYIVSGSKYKRVKLAGEDGKTLKGHAGGVTCTKNYVYIANDNVLHVFALDELKAADSKTTVKVKAVIPVDNRAAYCYSDDNNIYVGEFYRAGNYETEKSHYYKTPDGSTNKAIVSCYHLDGDGLMVNADAQPYPEYCISITGLVQGFATNGETFILSRSYGLKNSELEYHSEPKYAGDMIEVKFKANKEAESKEVPIYYLNSATKIKTLILPAFSEDVTIVGDRVVVTNEASANKYFVGKLFGADKVYSYPIYNKK